ALERIREALAIAGELGHPYTLAGAQVWAARLHHHRREPDVVEGLAEATLAVATTHQFAVFQAFATCWRGWARAVGKQDPEGLGSLRAGIAALTAAGHAQSLPFYTM